MKTWVQYLAPASICFSLVAGCGGGDDSTPSVNVSSYAGIWTSLCTTDKMTGELSPQRVQEISLVSSAELSLHSYQVVCNTATRLEGSDKTGSIFIKGVTLLDGTAVNQVEIQYAGSGTAIKNLMSYQDGILYYGNSSSADTYPTSLSFSDVYQRVK